MRFDAEHPSFTKLAGLECPDCGGKLLRGPRALAHNQNLTCRDCRMKYNVLIVDRQQTGFYEFPNNDTEFKNCVAVLGWEYIGTDVAGAAFYHSGYAPRQCLFEPCSAEYTGPGLYCCLACALADA